MISRLKESGFFLGWQVTTFIPVLASDMLKFSAFVGSLACDRL